MERHAADHLHIKVAHTQRTHTRFADHGKRLGEQLIEFVTLTKARAELVGFGTKGAVVQGLHRFLKRVDAGDDFSHSFQLPVITGAEYFFHGRNQHGKLTVASQGNPDWVARARRDSPVSDGCDARSSRGRQRGRS